MNISQVPHDAMKNRSQQASSKSAICYHCAGSFSASEVSQYTDSGQTALCPKCGVDAVLFESSGHPMTQEFARLAGAHWLGKT